MVVWECHEDLWMRRRFLVLIRISGCNEDTWSSSRFGIVTM